MDRAEANGIVTAVLKRYEDKLHDPPAGLSSQECFDVATGTPHQDFVELCREVKQALSDN